MADTDPLFPPVPAPLVRHAHYLPRDSRGSPVILLELATPIPAQATENVQVVYRNTVTNDVRVTSGAQFNATYRLGRRASDTASADLAGPLSRAALTALVVTEDYHHHGTLTVCVLTTAAGWHVVGIAATRNVAHADPTLGEAMAYEDALRHLREHVSYSVAAAPATAKAGRHAALLREALVNLVGAEAETDLNAMEANIAQLTDTCPDDQTQANIANALAAIRALRLTAPQEAP